MRVDTRWSGYVDSWVPWSPSNNLWKHMFLLLKVPQFSYLVKPMFWLRRNQARKGKERSATKIMQERKKWGRTQKRTTALISSCTESYQTNCNEWIWIDLSYWTDWNELLHTYNGVKDILRCKIGLTH